MLYNSSRLPLPPCVYGQYILCVVKCVSVYVAFIRDLSCIRGPIMASGHWSVGRHSWKDKVYRTRSKWHHTCALLRPAGNLVWLVNTGCSPTLLKTKQPIQRKENKVIISIDFSPYFSHAVNGLLVSWPERSPRGMLGSQQITSSGSMCSWKSQMLLPLQIWPWPWVLRQKWPIRPPGLCPRWEATIWRFWKHPREILIPDVFWYWTKPPPLVLHSLTPHSDAGGEQREAREE